MKCRIRGLHLTLPSQRLRSKDHTALLIEERWPDIRLTMLVSSSSVMNITPLAEPGRCRTITRPDMVTREPSFAVLSARME